MAIKIKIGKKKPCCGCSEAKKRGFGQGKPPKGEIYKKQDIYLEENEKLLREIDEDELSHIQSVLDSMDPDDMAFNQTFAGKTRVVIDFPTADVASEHGKFVNMWAEMGYKVDWEKAVVSGMRKLNDSSPEALLKILIGTANADPKTEKKVQMKIGKWLSKVNDITLKLTEIRDKIAEWANWEPSFTGTEVEKALGEDGAKNYYRLYDQLNMLVGEESFRELLNHPHRPKKWAKYWQTHAGYIKKNIDSLLSGEKFSIIITRHPIDILRMSDFEDITSCHSPPTRTSGTGEYYKCAVAEAHGHGAVAYVVETEDLLALTNTGNIDSAEQEIQEGEIFYDDKRPGDTDDLRPISRVRLRQMRYYRNPDAAEVRSGGTQLAVPERRIYGAGIPGFRDRVMSWARETQKEQLENVPKVGDEISFSKFVKFGGSHDDNDAELLLADFIGISLEKSVGNVIQDKTTEKELDLNLLGSVMERWELECARIANEWNVRYQACEIDYDVEDDGADGAYIAWSAKMEIKWDRDEWTSLPKWDYDTEWPAAELEDLGFAFVDRSSARISSVKRGPNDPAPIRFIFNIEPDSVSHIYVHGNHETIEFEGLGIVTFPDELNDVGVTINKIDDLHDAIKAHLTTYFKREGFIAGGAFMQLAIDIENELSSYEWDLETDGGYEDSYEATATLSHDFDPEALGIEPQRLLKILDARAFRLLVRKGLVGPVREAEGIEYWLDVANSSATDIGGTIRYTIEFRVTADSPDEQVALFRALVEEVDDEDEIAAIMNQVVKAVPTQDLSENKKYDANWAVKTWKLGL